MERFWVIVEARDASMKRKQRPAPDVVDPEIMESARKALHSDRPNISAKKCVVCGSPCAPNSAEGLCWVCRRLKISAWHEGEQVSAQE